MPLSAGSREADSGMSKAIYDALFENLKDGFKDKTPTEDVKNGWKKLAFAISTGVIDHIKSNMEIKGVTTSGKIDPNGPEITFIQNNDGTGHVE
jgi:hypothetical protein